MTAPNQDNQAQNQEKANDKELNFRALEARYQRQLEQERAARLEAERKIQEAQSNKNNNEDDEDDEPYVDRKKLNKTLAKFGEQTKQQTQSDIQKAVSIALEKEREDMWKKANTDFVEVMQHAQKFADYDPELAETILKMPEGFERQKLVYKNIKALGLHKPPESKSNIQEKVDANRRSPYYQPTSVGSAPYNMVGDFSPKGQEQAYQKLQELKKNLRI